MDKTKKEFKTFINSNDFTNLYSLSKTLRFELKPVGKTQTILEDAKVFEEDKTIQEKYEKTKPYFDRLHREFIKEALDKAVLSGLSDYFVIFKKWKADKKANGTELQKKEGDLRKEVVKFFDAQGKVWAEKYSGLKNKDIEVLFEEAVFESILAIRYGAEKETEITDESTGEVVSIFDSWKGFTGYFGKFFETRKNFYKDDGTATAIATRIIDQNLKRFCDNMLVFESIKNKIDFKEVGHNFGKALPKVFTLDFYNQCLLQDGIDTYNETLGGKTLENGEKWKGANELINLHKQKTGAKLPFLKALDKQILSEKEEFIDEIKDDVKLLEALKTFYKTAEEKIKILKPLLADFAKKNKDYDLSQIYIEKKVFDPNSCKWINKDAIDNFQKKLFEAMKSEKLAKYEKKENTYKFPNFIALSYVKTALENEKFEGNFWKEKYYAISGFSETTIWEQFLAVFSFEFNSLFERTAKDEDGKERRIGYDIFAKDLEALIKKNPFALSPETKITIKNFADSVLMIYQMAKYFAVEKKRAWNNDYELDTFYTDPKNGYLRFYENAYEEIVQVYNKLRNFLTKKPYSEAKWKLNFGNPTLADGWDKNKEADNFAVILRKNGEYFLGLMRKGTNDLFKEKHALEFSQHIGKGKYEKMVYKQMADPKRDFPKGVFSTKGLGIYNPPKNILEVYEAESFKTGSLEFSKENLWKLIDFYKQCIPLHPSWKLYDFTFSETKQYQNLNDFYKEVSESSYKITFQDVSEQYINEKNQNGELYLFNIRNKDWNLDKAKNGKLKTTQKNLHTLYFESLFSADNIAQNFPMKLNGQAEIFYRPKTEADKLGLKKDKSGKEVTNHKRYNENKIFFHIPLTLNRTKPDPYRFNAQINDFLAQNSNINIIGVDRGEKHLAYYSIITQKGEILESGSLNTIKGGNGQEVNYAEKLEAKAKNREQARKDWQAVEGIKDLKKGYISQVVRKLADLAVKHNAIIVFEDLNMRFKQIRGGIEKSVYQQLEKALIEKLNFLVNKGETDPKKAGHLLRAYQLTAPFETFKDMGKQTGIIFYTQAAYTSRIDPITGWRPHLYLKYSSAEKAKTDLFKFTKIEFQNGRFEFTYDIKNFREQKEWPKNTVWTVCSNVERFRWDKNLNQNNGGYTHYANLTDGKSIDKNPKSTKPDNLKKLFEKYGIDIFKDIKAQIQSLEIKGNEKFFEHLIFFFNLICQIRNTQKEKDGDENDFILSPVAPFFDSRKSGSFGKNLPKNGDDNGAYSIARKGIIILQKIKEFAKQNGNCEKMTWGDLHVSAIDWDDFTQNNQAI